MRAFAALGLSGLAGWVALVACSSFDEASVAMDAADAGSPAEADATVEAPGPADAGRCADPTAEVAGLYVMGGTETVGGAEPTAILRAPIRCDGALGAWEVQPVTIPFSVDRGAVGVVDDRVVFLHGLHSSGGPVYSNAVYVASRAADGRLGAFSAYTVPGLVQRWRVASVSTGDALVVMGGQGPGDAGALDTVQSVTLAAASAKVTPYANLDVSRQRFAATLHDGKIFVAGTVGTPSVGAVVGGGTVGGWRPLPDNDVGGLDMSAVTDGTRAFFFGGTDQPTRVWILRAGRETFDPATPLPMDVVLTTAASLRGFVYMLGGQSLGARVLVGRLSDMGIVDVKDGPPLPTARIGHMAFVY